MVKYTRKQRIFFRGHSPLCQSLLSSSSASSKHWNRATALCAIVGWGIILLWSMDTGGGVEKKTGYGYLLRKQIMCSELWKRRTIETRDRPLARNDGVCAPTTVPVNNDEWGAQRQELLFRHDEIPGLAQQCTEKGRILRALAAFDGRLHIGYGDYTHNTGPIAMHAFDPDPNVRSWVYLGTIYTDIVQVFRTAAGLGALYTPEVDGHGVDRMQAVGVYRLGCGNNDWTRTGGVIEGSAHNYDIAFQGEKMIVVTGGRDDKPAFLQASQDQGETWTEMFRQESLPGSYTRIKSIGASDDLVFFSGRDTRKKLVFAYIRYRNETDFQPITNLDIAKRNDSDRPPYLLPIIHRDELVVVAHSQEPPKGHYLASYRISGTELVKDTPWPTMDDGEEMSFVCSTPDSDPNKLLVLMRDRSYRFYGVFRTDSLSKRREDHGGLPVWEQALILETSRADDDDAFVSMAFLKNDLYLGTWNGDLHVVREFYKSAAEVPPPVTITTNHTNGTTSILGDTNDLF